MITKHMSASTKLDVKKSLSPSKSETVNKKQQSKNRIEAQLFTRLGKRKAIAQRILMKALACQELSMEPNLSMSLTSQAKASPSTGVSQTTKNASISYEPLVYPVEYLSAPKSNAKVKFQERVTVKKIPSHRSYNEDTRKTMWNGREEIERNCLRNKREFAADGRDWRSCKEEDEMLVLEGQLVHPETYLWLQRCRQQSVVRKLRAAKTMDYLLLANKTMKTVGMGHTCASAVTVSRESDSKEPPSKTFSMGWQQPFYDSPIQVSEAIKVRQDNHGEEGESVLDFPLLSSAATDEMVSSSGYRRLTQDHYPEQEKLQPARKTSRSSKFQVRRRTKLFRLPTRTDNTEMVAN